MRLRLVVVAAFAAMLLVSAYLAYSTRVLPGPAQAVAGSASAPVSDGVTWVTSLGWPEQPLGLAADQTSVLWERRDPRGAVAGIWSYDTLTADARRLLGPRQTGKATGFPVAAGQLLVWLAWESKRGEGPTAVEAYDKASERRWTVAPAGRTPAAAGRTVLWVERNGAGGGNDVIRGSNSVTDEEYAVTTTGRVRDVAGWNTWVAWVSGHGDKTAVWVGPYSGKKPRLLAERGSAVAMSSDRVAWTVVGKSTTRLESWDRETKELTVLRKVSGKVSSLTVTSGYAVWVATREDGGPQVWVYDFARGEAFAASPANGRQASPVVVAGSVYWADDRDGDWTLYRRTLR